MHFSRFYQKTALFLLVTAALAPLYLTSLLLFFPWRRVLGGRLVSFYSKICLRIFQVHISPGTDLGAFRKISGKVLIISNHSSFLDIFILSALFATAFVSKDEVRGYPVIGQIAWLMGCIFLDRASSRERLRVMKAVAGRDSARVLTVFPQGTTGSVTQRLSFKRGIFKAVELNPDITVLPVTLRYRDDDRLAWVMPQSLLDHARVIGSAGCIRLEAIVHKPISYKGNPDARAARICKETEEAVLSPLIRDTEET